MTTSMHAHVDSTSVSAVPHANPSTGQTSDSPAAGGPRKGSPSNESYSDRPKPVNPICLRPSQGWNSSITDTDVAEASAFEEALQGTRYTFIRELRKASRPARFGRHSCSRVLLARDAASGDLVAVQLVQKGALRGNSNRYVMSEVLKHHRLRHPCVVQLREVFATRQHIAIAMEYATGGCLYDHLKKAGHFSEAAARWFFQQLIIGLDHSHRQGVVNRDINLSNTLVQVFPGEQRLPILKIADFGYSKATSVTQANSKVGTLPFMAPEIFKANGPYDGTKTDIWSAGVMLYWMLTGQHPFQPDCQARGPEGRKPEQYMREMLRLIIDAKWSAVPAGIPVSDLCLDLLQHILVADPSQRVTIQQIYDHPWFAVDLPVEAEAMKTAYANNQVDGAAATTAGLAVTAAGSSRQTAEEIRLIFLAVDSEDSVTTEEALEPQNNLQHQQMQQQVSQDL